jgi:hypothetical protein
LSDGLNSCIRRVTFSMNCSVAERRVCDFLSRRIVLMTAVLSVVPSSRLTEARMLLLTEG